MNACKKVQKPRKAFDIGKMRTKGTDMEMYNKHQRFGASPGKKSAAVNYQKIGASILITTADRRE